MKRPLTENDIDKIREMSAKGLTQNEIISLYKIGRRRLIELIGKECRPSGKSEKQIMLLESSGRAKLIKIKSFWGKIRVGAYVSGYYSITEFPYKNNIIGTVVYINNHFVTIKSGNIKDTILLADLISNFAKINLSGALNGTKDKKAVGNYKKRTEKA